MSSVDAGRLHLGVTPWRSDRRGDAGLLAEQGELAERLGLESFWLPESHFVPRNPSPAPLLQLAVVAARTRSLRVATTSYLLPVRHPILAAEEVAVLDRLSEGRLILGVGRGFRSALFSAFGVERALKRRHFEHALGVMLAAWRGEAVAWEEHDGERRAVTLSPLPVQQPHPPLWMAAFGPKGLEQAGRLGFPYLASPLEPLAALEDNYRRHRRALAPTIDAAEMAVPVMRTVFVSEDEGLRRRVEEGLVRQAASWWKIRPSGLRASGPLPPIGEWALVGGPQEIGDALLRYRRRLGMTHLVVRGQVPEAPDEDVVRSLELLVELRRELGLA